MKKCEYCAKEISYFEQYCDDECQLKANKFFELRERFESLFSVIDGVCVFGIPIGLFIFSFAKNAGMVITVASFLILGIMIILLPFPTDNMISKFKLKKAIKITRIIGLVSLLFGVIAFLFMFFFAN
ncbi:MAG: hypothetical protein MJ089_02135 [Ruminococcus sp.]|nr:hypothetical protein [Ruminococcus sp.]